MALPTRPDSAACERLLDGQVHDGSPVAHLLEIARAPGRPTDLVGLDAARTAFLAARVRRPRHRAQRHQLTAATARRILAIKAVAAAVGVTLVGGVAFAASGRGLLEDTTVHHPAVVRHHPSGASGGAQLASTGLAGAPVVVGSAPPAQNPVGPAHQADPRPSVNPNRPEPSHTPDPRGRPAGPASGATLPHPSDHRKHHNSAAPGTGASPSRPQTR